MGPILLEPTYISPVWGGARISEIRGLRHGGAVNNGEAFDVTAHAGIVNTVQNGPYAGIKLDRLIRERHDEVVGDLADDATLQVVTMDPVADLSVQVHPDEAYAARVEGDHEKAESWYVLSAEPGATLIAGCTTSDTGLLRAAAAADTIGEAYGRRVAVGEGDFVLIPAGTMHALGAGVFAVEIGSFGNITYRICDWGRGRELHVDKAFDVLRTENRPFIRHLGPYDPAAAPAVREGVRHRLFEADVIDVHGEWRAEKDGRYQILTCVAGDAALDTPAGDVKLPYTASAIVPAAVRTFAVRGDCRIIQSRRPSAAPVKGAAI
jgi:mannose-6-phosphate isomerase